MEILGILIIYILSPLESFMKLGNAGTLSKYIGMVICGVFLVRILKKNKIYVPKESYFFLAFIFFGLISGFWAHDSSVSIRRSLTLIQLFTIYIITLNVINNNSKKLRGNLYNIIILSGIILSLYMIRQVLFLDSINQWTRVSVSDQVDVNHLASYLLPSFLFSVYYSFSKSSKHIVSSILIFIAILLTQSRGALLSLIIAIMMYILLSLKEKGKLNNILIGVLVLVISFLIVPNEFTYRIQMMFTNKEVLLRGSGRNIIWGWAWKEFLNKPIAGIGMGNFTALYRPPHSLFFQVLPELGITGICLLTLFVYNLLNKKNLRGIKNYKIEYTVVIALLTMSLTLDIFYQKYFWIIIGIYSSKKYVMK